MKTITENELYAEGCNHTGPVYYDHGARPYAAAINGKLLTSANRGVYREYKTAEAAIKAIKKVQE